MKELGSQRVLRQRNHESFDLGYTRKCEEQITKEKKLECLF